MRTVQFELQTVIMYAPGTGDQVEASFIDLDEPTGKIAHLVAIIKSEIGAATRVSMDTIDLSMIESAAAEKEEKDKDKEDGESDDDPMEVGIGLFQVMLMGGSDMKKVMITFKEILKEVGKIGGEKKMTMPMIDRMAYDDLEGCLKLYIGNFMQAS